MITRVVLVALLAATGTSPAPSPVRSPLQDDVPPGAEHAFSFTRAIYSDGFRRGRGSWSTDYPKADRQFLIGFRRLTLTDAFEEENPVALTDPNLRRFPVIYAVEVGRMALTPAERTALRGFLDAGGMLIVDDFWGSWEWANFAEEIRQVLPEYPIVDIPLDHPLLHTMYDIDEILQVPNVRNGLYGQGRTWEQDGFVPALRGIFDHEGRLLVAINWNTDLGDAWEWADHPEYPLPFSNFAYKLGINLLIYGMTH